MHVSVDLGKNDERRQMVFSGKKHVIRRSVFVEKERSNIFETEPEKSGHRLVFQY